MVAGLSEESQEQWRAFAVSVEAGTSEVVEREMLNQFLIGVHERGEELSAHDLKTLVDELDPPPELTRELISFIAPALGLLETYDRSVRSRESHDGEADDEEEPETAFVGDDEVGPGILVI